MGIGGVTSRQKVISADPTQVLCDTTIGLRVIERGLVKT